MSTLRMKVRAFEDAFELPPNAAVRVVGTIESSVFVVRFNSIEVRVPITGRGVDHLGVFAEIEEQTAKAANGTIARVTAEPDDDHDGGIGCQIALVWPAPNPVEAEKAVDDQLARLGLLRHEVNLVIPTRDRSLSVYFSPSGHIDGFGGSTLDAASRSGGRERGH